MTIEQISNFLKSKVSQEKFVEVYGERPCLDGDHIKSYVTEYFNKPDILENICSDLDIK